METACILKEIKEVKIPQVFTISAPIDPYLPGFTHEQNDWIGYGGSSSKLENSDGCIEILKEINSKTLSAMHTFNSLYPDQIKHGSSIANVGGLDRIITTFENYNQKLSKMIDVIQERQSSNPQQTINLSKLNKLYEQFVVMGIEIVNNKWKIPDEFLQKEMKSNLIDKAELEAINTTITPYIAQLAEPQTNLLTINPEKENPMFNDLSDSVKKLVL